MRVLVALSVLIASVTPLSAATSKSDRALVALKVIAAPAVDGKADDAAWAKAVPLVTYDPLAKLNLTVRVVYTDDRVFFLAQFPDETRNSAHKTQVWDPRQSRYRIGTDREDTFVIKWNMEPRPVDLRIDAEEPYKADIWYWKSHRTDHAGHADDKMHIYSSLKTPNSKALVSRNGLRFYLSRPGDNGQAAYKVKIHGTHVGDRTDLYEQITPLGSRADVKARGIWQNGVWTVEFSRKLITGNADDVQFDTAHSYLFGVSRYEIAGRRMNERLQEPYFGAGEISEILRLRFE